MRAKKLHKVTGHNEFGTLGNDALKTLISGSEERHWKDVLWSLDPSKLQKKKEWFENKRKGYFYLMNALTPETRVLDIGAGSGIISEVLSSYCKEVVALDYNPDFIKFMGIRFRQDKRDNVKVVRANALELPFKDSSFDEIIVNGVLEWVPNFKPKGNPKAVQQDFLSHCRSKIATGGRIVVGIENRMHFNYLMGDTPHGDYPFTTVLPRPIADVVSRVLDGKPYRNYIYSAFGLKRLLEKAGFVKTKLFVISPTYYNPIHIMPFDDNEIIKQVAFTADSLPEKPLKKAIFIFLLKTGILKHLMHSFYIVGEKR